MEKKRVITSFNKLNPALKLQWNNTYPDGYDHDIIEVDNPIKGKFKAVFIETEDTIYLVKVNSELKKDYKEVSGEAIEEASNDEDFRNEDFD